MSPKPSYRLLYAFYCCLIIVVLFSGKETNAQYPDEICHWRCDIISCDYYHEHCDYDCYEDCYPYRSSPSTLSSIKTTGASIKSPITEMFLSPSEPITTSSSSYSTTKLKSGFMQAQAHNHKNHRHVLLRSQSQPTNKEISKVSQTQVKSFTDNIGPDNFQLIINQEPQQSNSRKYHTNQSK